MVEPRKVREEALSLLVASRLAAGNKEEEGEVNEEREKERGYL